MSKFARRDFMKSMAAVPFLGYFAFSFKNNILAEQAKDRTNYLSDLGINRLDILGYQVPDSNAKGSKPIRFGLAGQDITTHKIKKT